MTRLLVNCHTRSNYRDANFTNYCPSLNQKDREGMVCFTKLLASVRAVPLEFSFIFTPHVWFHEAEVNVMVATHIFHI